MARIMVFTSLPQPAGTSRNVGQPTKPPPLTLHPMEMLTDPVNRKGHNREGCHFTRPAMEMFNCRKSLFDVNNNKPVSEEKIARGICYAFN